MTWTAVGSLVQSAGPTSFTLSGTPAVGDLILCEVISTTSFTFTATALSSSNVTWTPIGGSFNGSINTFTSQMFMGTVTSSVANATVTVTYSGGTPTVHIDIVYREFHSTVGSWTFDVRGTLDSTGTNNWPAPTPAGPGELYWGHCQDNAAATAPCGAMPCTSGSFTYEADGNSNGSAYGLNIGTAIGPVWTDGAQAFGLVVLMQETSSVSSGPPIYPRPSNRVVTQVFQAGPMGAATSR